jgi:cytochrome c-type biogenesis protein CcmH
VTRVAGAILMVALAVIGGPAAAITPQRFEDPAQQHRYEQLLTELRCLVCQNETLAESEAPLADDLRREVAELVRRGESDAGIRGFLVARYGDFVLYRPPSRPSPMRCGSGLSRCCWWVWASGSRSPAASAG